VYSYFEKYGRDLPWRAGYDPYHIFISEVMLQQTQVDRVIPKFIRFVKEIPTFEALAEAPFGKVFTLWQGLGYNRRARSLQNAAILVMNTFNGVLPDSLDKLITLPGIGPATAASIAAFAFNKPTLFLETNIRTVYIHHFFKNSGVVRDNRILPLAQAALDKKNPRKWYSALMDYGTYLKKEYGNPTRRSMTYKKQSPFHGSRRQLRGLVLKLLVGNKKLTMEDIYKNLECSRERIGKVVELLVKERMITEKTGYLYI